ncbi:MAG: hypothetical protein V4685_06730 [Bacteroidota bacterium]
MRTNKLYLILFVVSICACKNNSTSNSTLNSISIDEKQDRIQTLAKYVHLKSGISDGEFDLFNVNGFDNERLSVPGASSWNYKFGVMVNKNDIYKWTNDLRDTTFKAPDFNWILKLIRNRPQNWSLHSKPKFYIGNSLDDILVVYENEGAIFRQIINL